MHDATIETANRTPLPLRHDTIFGVCEAIGEDLGINANLPRVALGSIVLFNPLMAVSAYAALGVVVLASRLLFPNRRAAVTAEAQAVPAEAANEQDTLAAAA